MSSELAVPAVQGRFNGEFANLAITVPSVTSHTDADGAVSKFTVTITNAVQHTWSVSQRFSGFENLRNSIKSDCAAACALFPAKGFGKVTGPALDKRRAGLQEFLQAVAKSGVLAGTPGDRRSPESKENVERFLGIHPERQQCMLEHMSREHDSAMTAGRLEAERQQAVHAAAVAALRAELDETRSEYLAQARAEAQAEFRERWQSEARLRTKIQEELMTLKGTIRVFCRARPLLPHEAKAASCLSFPKDGNRQTCDLSTPDATGHPCNYRFCYDRVFSPETVQVYSLVPWYTFCSQHHRIAVVW
jgi:hypothetical protein